MKRLFLCFIILPIIFTFSACNRVGDVGSSEPPHEKNGVSFDSLNELYSFIYSDEQAQLEWIAKNYGVKPSRDEDKSVFIFDEVKRIYESTQRVTKQPIPIPLSDESIRSVGISVQQVSQDLTIGVKYQNFSVRILYPSEQYMSYIQDGSLKGYYKNAYPRMPRPISYDRQEYLRVKLVRLERTDVNSKALLVIDKIAAPYIEFIRNGLIIRIYNYHNYGSLDQKNLIELANELEFIDITKEGKE